MMIKESDVQRSIFYTRRSSALLIMPNFTPLDWWECDVWVLSKARRVTEYEIKLTIGDFHADFDKKAEKYERLTRGDCHCNRFIYVVREEMVERVMLDAPWWAGVIAVRGGRSVAGGTVRQPTTRHDRDVDDKVVAQAKNACYWRMWNERIRRISLGG